MNAYIQETQRASEGTDLYSVLGEPEDPNSDWDELKCTQLSGYDYVFLSRRINKKLANKTTLSEFILDVYQILETSHERAKIYIYSSNNIGKMEFAGFDINWKRGTVSDFHITPVKNVEQKKFIRTLFEHSGMLVGEA